jgi:hypothetical protein
MSETGGLLRGHVLRRAHHRPEAGVQRALGQRLSRRLRHAEVDHLGNRLVVIQGHEDVGRLEVAMDDALVMGVRDRLTDWPEQLQPLLRGELAGVAALRDRDALDQLHDEEGRTLVGDAAVENLG